MLKVAEELKRRGFKIGGMATREVRERGVRVGFEIIDLATGEKGILAWVGGGSGPRVGKYLVNLRDLDGVGVKAVRRALSEADVVFVDEVGPMELYSEEFRSAVREAAGSGKPLIATVHYRARDRLISELKTAASRLFEVNTATREEVYRRLLGEVSASLKG